MKFGLSHSEYDYIVNAIVTPLKKLGFTIYYYGSRARGDFNKYSDLDLMLEGPKNKSIDKTLGLIREELSNGNFPYKVDLVLLSEFADSYKSSYEKDKTLF